MLSTFASRIQRTIRARALLDPAERVLVGVSGGADSVALACVLKELGHGIGIAHLNHRLRGADSDEDERFTAQLAERLGAPFFASAAEFSPDASNLEELGRNARRTFFESVRSDSGFDKIALGHNRDDRAETFLLHLTRGAGLEGLTSMRSRAGFVVRPLIEVGRAEITSYLDELRQPWRTDITNADLRFARNRMRHIVVPELTRTFNPRLSEALLRTLDLLEDEHSWMQALTVEWLERYAQPAVSGFAVDAAALAAAPFALARRVIRESIRKVSGPLTGVRFGHIEAVLDLAAEGKSGKTAEIHGGAIARREFEWIVFSRRAEPVADFAYDLPVPGSVRAPALGKRFRAFFVESAQPRPGANPMVFVDGERLGPYVRIRAWKPGDYYRPAGRPAGKLKKLFQQARIPRSQRSGWPVFVTDSGIVWVASFPVSREFAVGERSQKIVALEALPD
ncbi:MAG TPA: tRNA lysidine(34) synthetase TilS [Terriglobia bacterium]|nr:tRNA lysidine(34) synthetase TilS [Terriglobia bacterium]